MFFIGNRKFEKLEHVYGFLEGIVKDYIENGKKPNLIIYYNKDELYNSSKEEENPIFYISRGIKANLLGAFLLKYKGLKGTIKYNGEVLWQF